MFTILSFAVALASLTGEGFDPSDSPKPPIGTSVAAFDLEEGSGKIHHLSDWSDRRLICLVFLRVGCPVAELQAGTLADLATRFESKGVSFLGVSVSDREDPGELDRYAGEHCLGFPFLRGRGDLVERLGVSRTPEVVLLDERRRIRYRGRVDDRYAVGSRRTEARYHDLANALEDLLAGREVGRPETEAVGCPVDRPSAIAERSEVTYYREVAPLLDRRCVSCHRAGQVGPFSLGTYREAASRASAIAEVVEDGRMPPWHADPRFGKFVNDVHLSDGEKNLILRWVESGCPEGNPANLPRPIERPSGWSIPKPDLVVSMPEPFTVPAQGVVDYQFFEVDPGFTEDRWVRGAEIREGNRKVVHHCTVFLKGPNSGQEADFPGELESFCLATTTPGSLAMILPPGMAKRIPAGWRLLFVVHYSPVGTVQEDRTSIGLLFADRASVRKEVATNLLVDLDLRIPPHQANHRVERTRRFDSDVFLLSMFPHMHVRGKSFRYDVIFPDGRVETLLNVPRYDFNWQNRYELEQPRKLPAGTTLRCVATYDNSAKNPANPNPAATVLAGQQTWDEMFNGYYDIVLADQDLTHPPTRLESLWAAIKRRANPTSFVFVGSASSLFFLRWKGRCRSIRVGKYLPACS